MPLVREWQCIQCGAMQFERARQRCTNPDWHDLPPLPEPEEQPGAESQQEAS